MATKATGTIGDLIPWEARRLDAYAFAGMWSFNPSVIRIDAARGQPARWLCSVRCANYHMLGSVAQEDAPSVIRNRNLMLELDPVDLSITRTIEMGEVGGLRRRRNAADLPVIGYEDLRLVWTARDGLIAIANTMQFSSDRRLEIAILDLTPDYQIMGATPLRGAWSSAHQKNWSPYQHTEALRLLYSVEEGGVHDEVERIIPTHPTGNIGERKLPGAHAHVPKRPPFREHVHGSTSVKTFSYGRRRVGGELATVGPGARDGRIEYPLRGGTQLVQIADHRDSSPRSHLPILPASRDRWLGLAHGCRVTHEKYYWHVWCVYDGLGNLLATSEPIKLSAKGIEFAAGLALEPETGRLVVSFGVEDDTAWLGVTNLPDVLGLFAGSVP